MIKKAILAFVVSIVLSGCLPSIARRGQQGSPAGSREFAQGKVVSGFPNLPRYPESQVIESVADDGSYGASFFSQDSLEVVSTFYNDSLPQFGWDTQFVKNTETNYTFRFKNAQFEGTIIVNVAADNKSTAITYSVSPR
ncbi:hypothetical protein HYS90_02670 [Candidatus Curtissbacteria bacterium]|nr:hypothetical protein [Candidatus Curtissbacteria bacterium]